MTLPMQWVTPHVSTPKRGTDRNTDLKKNPDTHDSIPSLLRILVILFHTNLALSKFRTTADHSSSAAEIFLIRYQKEVNISMGHL